jgi:predicted ribosomally synthesized peptide with SipW-like signal peptide
MKKKAIIISMVAVLFVSIMSISSSLAWLTDKDTATNKVSIGNVNIEVLEKTWVPADGLNIWPGKVTAKDPVVHNIGLNPSYTRIKVSMDSSLSNFISINYDTDATTGKWFKDGDYYYYKGVLQPNTTSTALFTQFTLLNTYKEPATGVTPSFDIIVEAEAVQSQGFEPVGTSDASLKAAILNAFSVY